MRATQVVLCGAVAVAGVLAIAGAGGPNSPSAELAGSPFDRATEAATFAELADRAVSTPAPPPPAKPASLADQLELDHIVRVADHYEAPLKDGRRAILTLDPDLQTLAEKLLDEARAPRGAIVAMAPDGRILALAGRRTEEPKGSEKGTFDWRLATDAWAPAASVFKLVTASALVSAGVGPDDKVCFHGGIRSVIESNLRDDKRDTACQTLTFGVAHSNNAILGKLAYQHLEPVALDRLAKVIGIDQALGTLPGVVGQLALPQTHDLEFAKSAAGFTGSNLSGVGGALLAATFADGGEQPTPRLVDTIVAANGTDRELVPVATTHRVVTAEVAHAVQKMMVATCDLGSAAKSFGRRKGVRVAGKTGTLTRTEPFYMEHSWFVGYAPADKPEIVVSVVLGNPENWHLRGQEAAKRLIDRVIDRATRREKDRTQKVAIAKRVQW